MRTTLTLEEDLARALKGLAHRSGKTFKEVVNDAIRAGLESAQRPARAKRYRLEPSSLGGVMPGFDLTKALALAADLEDAEIARKLEHRK